MAPDFSIDQSLRRQIRKFRGINRYLFGLEQEISKRKDFTREEKEKYHNLIKYHKDIVRIKKDICKAENLDYLLYMKENISSKTDILKQDKDMLLKRIKCIIKNNSDKLKYKGLIEQIEDTLHYTNDKDLLFYVQTDLLIRNQELFNQFNKRNKYDNLMFDTKKKIRELDYKTLLTK